MGWKMIAEGRNYKGGEDEIEEMLQDAYREGCEKGYRKAMREMEGGFGERGGYSGGGYSGGGSNGGGYGNRYEEDDDDDMFGERRGVRGTGRYAGEYRRRRR